MGRGLLGISKKIISIFKTGHKLVTKFGQFKKLKWPFSSLQFCIFCCCWKYTESSIFLEKMIGQWIPDRDERGIARDIKKNYFYFWNATKNGNKVGTIYKVGTFQLLNCPNLVSIFCQVLKMETIFLDIPSNPPPIAVRNSLTNLFFPKRFTFLYIFNNKKVPSLYRDIHPGDSWPYITSFIF